MIGVALLLALHGSLHAPEQDASPPSIPPPAGVATAPPPPQPIAGLLGFTSISKIVFDALPDRPHRLEANYGFPERVRWWLSFGDQNDGNRSADYRYGGTLWGLPVGEEASIAYEGDEGAAVLRRMELRRAAMLWPDGVDWKTDAEGWRAAIVGLIGEPVGELRGRRGEGSRPRVFAVLDLHGNEQESLEVLEWKESAERWWPARLRLRSGGEPVWTETIERVDTRTRYLDLFYLPLDRQVVRNRASPLGSILDIRTLELPARFVRRLELPAGLDWERARDRARVELAAESDRLARQGFAIDGIARFEIDANGDPAFLIFAMDSAARTPADYAPLEERAGLFAVLADVNRLSRSTIEELLAAVPERARPLPAYVRWIGDASGERIQVVLPLVPAD